MRIKRDLAPMLPLWIHSRVGRLLALAEISVGNSLSVIVFVYIWSHMIFQYIKLLFFYVSIIVGVFTLNSENSQRNIAARQHIFMFVIMNYFLQRNI